MVIAGGHRMGAGCRFMIEGQVNESVVIGRMTPVQHAAGMT
jgi:hypothetical protein